MDELGIYSLRKVWYVTFNFATSNKIVEICWEAERSQRMFRKKQICIKNVASDIASARNMLLKQRKINCNHEKHSEDYTFPCTETSLRILLAAFILWYRNEEPRRKPKRLRGTIKSKVENFTRRELPLDLCIGEQSKPSCNHWENTFEN